VRYELDGKRGQLYVDDYKFEAEPTRKILAEIEEKAGRANPGTACRPRRLKPAPLTSPRNSRSGPDRADIACRLR
jgi:hypothetical protein